MNRSVGTKIAAGFFLALVSLLTIGVVCYRSTSRLMATSELVAHTHKVLENLESLHSGLKDAEAGQRGFIITGDEHYLEHYHSAPESMNQRIKTIRDLTSDNPAQQRRLDALESLIASKFAEMNEAVELRKEKAPDNPEKGFQAALAVIKTDKGKVIMEEIRKLLREMTNTENDLLKARADDAREVSSDTKHIIIDGTLAAIVLLSLFAYVITSSTTRSLTAAIDSLTSSANELMAFTSQLTSSSTETATAVSETTTTMEEVRQTAQVANQKTRQVSENAQRAVQTSESGRKATEQTIEGMSRIRQQMDSIAESMVRLSEQTQAVGQIIATVDDLAQQSNLLAVNASIEAAKAGEHGRGFAVVAQEVKSLADQSKQATAQVRTILSDIQKATNVAVMATEQGSKAVETGVHQSSQAGETIVTLTTSIGEAAQAASQIAASSQQQLVGMNQVGLAIGNIKKASTQNVESARQLESAARNLNELGQKLGTLVGQQRG